MAQPAVLPFLAYFASLQDPCQAAKVLYPLPELLLLLPCGTVVSADNFVELALWGGEHLLFLRRFLPFARGIPSHDTLCEVVAALDPALFKTAKAKCIYKGRKPTINDAELHGLRDEEKLGPAAIARRLGIGRASVYWCSESQYPQCSRSIQVAGLLCGL